ncbi:MULTISPECIES: DUF378 domain-containing protein [unclassified Roseitalea]|uniref:DUF378 domain-containing protein n=1 Tax=unclassified Roseitalea TaxID=2639107 RepID=UPI00273E9DCC|nr:MULTISPECIES: DUF378 domain-containing protein [unclassified Roseitalea]
MRALNITAMILIIVGAINWGLVGLFRLDLVRLIFGGELGTVSALSAIIYILVGIAGVYGIYLLKPLMDTSSRSHTSNAPGE